MVLKISGEVISIEPCSASEHDVARVNSIAKKYKKERQEGKTPTFALTL